MHGTKRFPAYKVTILLLIILFCFTKCSHCTHFPQGGTATNYVLRNVPLSPSGLLHTVQAPSVPHYNTHLTFYKSSFWICTKQGIKFGPDNRTELHHAHSVQRLHKELIDLQNRQGSVLVASRYLYIFHGKVTAADVAAAWAKAYEDRQLANLANDAALVEANTADAAAAAANTAEAAAAAEEGARIQRRDETFANIIVERASPVQSAVAGLHSPPHSPVVVAAGAATRLSAVDL